MNTKRTRNLTTKILMSVVAVGLLMLSSCVNPTSLPSDWSNTKPVGVEVGMQAPKFSLPNQDGKSQSLTTTRGSVTVVYFWASSSNVCKDRTPAMKILNDRYAGRGFTIYSVAINDDKSSWKKYIAENKLNWLHGIDENKIVADQYNVPGLSSYYLLDKRGTIIAVGNATDISNNVLDSQISNALSSK
jgi:peroxiredoxin